jgi:superfamily I DNA and/or RNA helicase
MKDLLKAFQKRLTNLTAKNRSIYLSKLSKRFDIDLKELFSFSGEYYGSALGKILKGREIKLIEVADPRSGLSNEVSKRLKSIKRQSDFIETERGNNDLYIGWPYVEGKLLNGTPVRAPLIFFPVSLSKTEKFWQLIPRKEVAINLNKSLFLAYSFYSDQSISDDFLEMDMRDFDPDFNSFVSHLFQYLKDSPVQFQFSSEIFEKSPKEFISYQKDKYSKIYDEGALKVIDYGVLGLFPQAGSFIVPDYNSLIDGDRFSDLEDFFASKISVEKSDHWQTGSHYRKAFLDRVKEVEIMNPLPMDASQENAMKAIKRGHSIVVQGPPGSGKSQLITNLICDNIAKGKKVLLVCQKRVALDVVFERLNELGLSPFVARVSDFKNDRSRIFEKINNQIEAVHEYQQLNSGIDSILLERDFLKTSKRIDSLEEELNELRTALFNEGDCGISPKEIYLNSDPEKPHADGGDLFRHFKLNESSDLKSKFESFYTFSRKLEKESYPWKIRKDFKDFGSRDLIKIKDILLEIPKFQNEVNEEIKEFFFMGLSYDEHKNLVDRKKDLTQFVRLIEDSEILNLFQAYVKGKVDPLWLENRKQIILDFFIAPGPETTLESADLGPSFYKVSRSIKRRKNPLFKVFRFASSGINKGTKELLKKNNLQANSSGLASLERKISNRMNLEHNISLIKKSAFDTNNFPQTLDRPSYLLWFEKQEKSLKAKNIVYSFRFLENFFDFEKSSFEVLKNKIDGLILLSEKIIEKVEDWGKQLKKTQIFNILLENKLGKQLSDTIDEDFEDLCHFDTQKASLQKHEIAFFEIALNEKNLSVQKAWELLENSLHLDWINHLEEKYPVLRQVSTNAFEKKIEELKEKIKSKLDLTRDLVLLRSRERTYRDLEFNRLYNQVTYRELKHQVTKRRKIWPLRKVIGEYYRELFDLIPCWMASPESVSAMFPLEEMFDLVLFDEASQCFSEKGIPALYRAKQIGIFGDKNQLSPFDLYQARYEDPESEYDLDLEVESLLDLGSNYLMEIPLNEHYRSESLELIGFSNEHFYKGLLNCVPYFSLTKNESPPIEFFQLNNGIWEEFQNRNEAEKVVEKTVELIDSNISSIGIITFNYIQQQLILDLLEKQFQEREDVLPENLFVKNLENVQGDERDYILFSPAYAPDSTGTLRMQFGSLNKVYGERRLNVAITRARKKIFIFSSINPTHISVDHLQNEGPKLFIQYLEYAKKISAGKNSGVWKKPNKNKSQWYLSTLLSKDLKEKGFESSEIIPFADLVISSPGESRIACFTDDDYFFSSSSTKHFFAYAPFELERKNWANKYVFSRNYWMDSEKEVDGILHYLNWQKK